MLKSSPDRYSAIPITIHWLTALLVILALASGFRAGNAIDSAIEARFLRIHIPVAILILLLAVLRIVW